MLCKRGRVKNHSEHRYYCLNFVACFLFDFECKSDGWLQIKVLVLISQAVRFPNVVYGPADQLLELTDKNRLLFFQPSHV